MAITWPAQANANIAASTQRLFLRSVVDQVLFKMPLYARLLMADQVKKVWPGGDYITRPVKTARMYSLAQDYGPNDALTAGSLTLLDAPRFLWKMFQVPVLYGVKERFMNSGGKETQLLDLIEFLVDTAQDGAREHMYRLMYDATTTDDGDKFQSVIQALDHGDSGADVGYTYGGLIRDISAGTRNWWQSADMTDFDGAASHQDTQYSASIDTVRRGLSAVNRYARPKSEFLIACGSEIHLALKSWIQTERISTEAGPLAKYGFNSFTIDSVECVEDIFLRNANITNSHKWLFIYHVPSWELRFHPERMMAFTGFTWQGDRVGGFDQWLARILNMGNFMCWQPNVNMWLSNVVVTT